MNDPAKSKKPQRPRPLPPGPLAPGLAARLGALSVIARVRDQRKTLDEAFAAEPIFTSMAARDIAFAHAIATAMLRRSAAIERLIARFVVKPPPPAIMQILALVAAERGVLDVPAHAAVTNAVEITKRDPRTRHFQGLVNAVARRLSDAAPEILAEKTDPHTKPAHALAERWVKNFGAAIAAALEDAHGSEPPLDLTFRHGDTKIADELIASHQAMRLPTGSIRLKPTRVETLPGFAEGAFWVQDAGAALPARLLGDVRGLRVADLCAAPGGKTLELADAGGLVIAIERDAARLSRLRKNLARTQFEAQIVCADVLTYKPDAPFDHVLLDAPCSATGTIRRHPEIPLIKDTRSIIKAAELQRALIEAAAKLVRTGGRLVYSVCSLEPEEGEDQIAAFLARNPSFTREPVAPGEAAIDADFINPQGDLRTLPCHWPQWGGLDGFYAARLRRQA